MVGIPRLAGLWVVALSLLSLAAGCGEKQVQIRGQVTLDGQPLETGVIAFIPEDKSKGQTAGATISEGAYQVQGSNLPPPGSYRVEIRSQKKTGKKIPAGSPSPPGTMIDEMIEAVPLRYNKTSTLRQELKTGSNTCDFPLTTKAGP